MKDKRDKYSGPITVTLAMPIIKLLNLSTVGCSKPQKIINAVDRRCFILDEDWVIGFENISYMPLLNGQVKIPTHVDNKVLKFDGASVPAPASWLANFLSLGIVRPMGVMFCGSIVHDFAYKYGYLLVSKGEGKPFEKVKINRSVADKIFRDMISSIHNMSLFGWLSWYLVKVGWIFGTQYHYRRWDKPFPLGVIASLVTMLSLLTVWLFDGFDFLDQRFNTLISHTFLGFLLIYIAMAILKNRK